MPLPIAYIEELVFKFNSGSITSEELQILGDWYNSHDDRQTTIPLKADDSAEMIKSRMLTGLLSKIVEEQPPQVIKHKLGIRWFTAAAAVLVFAIGTWIVFEYKSPVLNSPHKNIAIEPGGNKATLTLTDGRTIQLSQSQTGIVAGREITYTNGSPVENTAPVQPHNIQNLLALQTPRGGTYKVMLSDGTQVWLNAQTTIKYPAHFSTEERIVQLEGEAFFKVKSIYQKNGKKVPFKVITKRQEVEVLGTQFNMTAYTEQLTDKTTLVEGKVKVNVQQNQFVLVPNDQAVTIDGKTIVKQVDPSNYIAWIDGKFNFNSKTFKETMDEIGRWYDLNIVYENEIPNEELVGDAFRNQNIDFVFRLLDVAKIDYKLDIAQRKLTIKGKRNRF